MSVSPSLRLFLLYVIVCKLALLRFCGLSRGNDPNNLLVSIERMTHNQETHPLTHAEENHPLFILRVVWIVNESCELIIEYRLGFKKRNAMFLLIDPIFSFIPSECDSCHIHNDRTTFFSGIWQVFYDIFFRKLPKILTRGSPSSGLLRCLAQPRGEAARPYASASRAASPGTKGGRNPSLKFSNPFSRPPFALRCKRIVRQSLHNPFPE